MFMSINCTDIPGAMSATPSEMTSIGAARPEELAVTNYCHHLSEASLG